MKNAKTTYRIHGMDCGDCANTLQKRLSSVRGVKEVDVSFATAKMSIVYDGEEERLLRAVKQAGFMAERQEAHSDEHHSFWVSYPKVVTTIASGVLFLLAWLLAQFDVIEGVIVSALYGAAIFIGGYRIAMIGITGLRSRTIGIELLMSIAVVGAMFIGEWAEGAAVIFLFSIGETLEAYSMDRTRKSVRSLMGLAPKEALIRRDGKELMIEVDQIEIGDLMIIRPGEKIAMDGVVVSGYSMINEASITGESMPVEKNVGDDVYAGTINFQGSVEVEVLKLAKDNTISRIIEMIEKAQQQKAPSQKFVDTFAQYYTPAVIIVAIGIAILPPLFTGQALSEWFYRALVMLVVSCPCALVISTPVAIISAIGNAARHGVLVKGGVHLERLGALSAVAFDKTGTLTLGVPVVADVKSLGKQSEAELIRLAAAVEARSEHPLAQAVIRYAGDRQIAFSPGEQFRNFVGQGAVATVDGRQVFVGNPKLFKERLGIQLSREGEELINQFQQAGHTIVLIGQESDGHAAEHVKGFPSINVLGLIAIRDKVRDESRQALQQLRNLGIDHMYMLTGDNEGTAQAISSALNDRLDYRAELMPEDKSAVIEALMKKHRYVAMVGDGVNDAPALATATVGIAMGTVGTDTALETADIALMADDLSRLPYAVQLSRRTLAIIKQNITFALVLKAVFLLAIIPGFVTLWLAVVADVGASLLVILNGMRLLRKPE